MRIIVCLKQVPATNEVRLDPVTHAMLREGVESVLNPFDAFALEEAIRIKERSGGTVTALSMGIPAVAGLLSDAVALGADRAVLLSDRAFAGADTLATAYALSLGVAHIRGFDLIICGKQATDGDTAQVGPSLAERLGIPHAANVCELTVEEGGTVLCRCLTDDGYRLVRVNLPCLVAVTKEINVPRLPSIAGIRRAKGIAVETLSAADVGGDTARLGLRGSATRVIKTFRPVREVRREDIGGTPGEQAETLLKRLRERRLLEGSV